MKNESLPITPEAVDTTNPDVINETYTNLNNKYHKLYQFVMNYSEYIYSRHDYANNKVPLTMVEVHTLSYIEDHPGVTATELVAYWEKTKGAISQVLSKLEKTGLITKETTATNAKTKHLYITDKGVQISQTHKRFDIQDIQETMTKLNEQCSAEEINAFLKVIAIYNDMLKNEAQ